MSTHTFTLSDPRRANDIVQACHEQDRPPQAVTFLPPTLTLTFEPDLTANEQTLLADLVAAYGTMLTLAEYRGIKDDIAGLASYHGLASPTNAQTVAAVKAIIRVLRVVVRS